MIVSIQIILHISVILTDFLFLCICFAHGKVLYCAADVTCSKLQAWSGGCLSRALDLPVEYAAITSVPPEGISAENTTSYYTSAQLRLRASNPLSLYQCNLNTSHPGA